MISAVTKAVSSWWYQLTKLVTHEYNTMGPESYSILLLFVGALGYYTLSRSMK